MQRFARVCVGLLPVFMLSACVSYPSDGYYDSRRARDYTGLDDGYNRPREAPPSRHTKRRPVVPPPTYEEPTVNPLPEYGEPSHAPEPLDTKPPTEADNQTAPESTTEPHVFEPLAANESPPVATATPPKQRKPRAVTSPGVLALIQQAQAQAKAGDADKAVATLERALRIEPQNPWIWHRLAVIRLQQEQWQQTIDLASKSNSFSGDDPDLLYRNWRVIGMALEKVGDSAGAERAMLRSQQYRERATSSQTL